MKRIALIVDTAQAGRRLDRFLADARPERSRSEVQRDVRDGNVSVSGDVTYQPSRRLRANEEVIWEVSDRPPLTPRPISLAVIYEDDHLVVVDKPVGLVVHPGAGTDSPTLVEGLLVERALPPSDDPARPGIVHRLDKETSGVILVAKTPAALKHLQRQFAKRSVAKSYIAVVSGIIREEEGTIDAPIGRDPASPRRMSVQSRGRTARTDFRVLRRFEDSTLLLVRPRTGRTHQLRVHLSYIGHPVVGDSIYGSPTSKGSGQSGMGRRSAIAAQKEQPRDSIYGSVGSRDRVKAANDTPGRSLRRQAQAGDPIYGDTKRGRPTDVLSDSGSRGPDRAAHDTQGRSAYAAERRRLMLHAWRISLRHPDTEEELRFEAPVPPEFPDFAYEELPWERMGETT